MHRRVTLGLVRVYAWLVQGAGHMMWQPVCLLGLALLVTSSIVSAGTFSAFIVMGDSFSDTGNVRDRTGSASGGIVDYPSHTFNYSNGRFTNDNATDPASLLYAGVWHEQLAQTFLGLPPAGAVPPREAGSITAVQTFHRNDEGGSFMKETLDSRQLHVGEWPADPACFTKVNDVHKNDALEGRRQVRQRHVEQPARAKDHCVTARSGQRDRLAHDVFRAFQVRRPVVVDRAKSRADRDDLVEVAHGTHVARAAQEHAFEEIKHGTRTTKTPASRCAGRIHGLPREPAAA